MPTCTGPALVSLQGFAPENGAALRAGRRARTRSNCCFDREQLGYLHDAIAELPERLRYVVESYFFDQRQMADIAAELGVTESRISQLRAEALKLLRHGLAAASRATRPDADRRPRRPRRSQLAAAYRPAQRRRPRVQPGRPAVGPRGPPGTARRRPLQPSASVAPRLRAGPRARSPLPSAAAHRAAVARRCGADRE